MDGSLPAGTIFANKYEILSLAGSGGMGTVYKAKQIDLERIVALKLLDPGLVADSESQQRFIREAQSINQLSNEHIATFFAYEIGADELPYIVMEYLEGKSLRSVLLAEGRLDEERMKHIAIQISEAMAHAHAKGIIHRDLKPENIILLDSPEKDFVKIIDFGLAKIQVTHNSGQKLTQTGALIGSVHYLSPEQCTGHKADRRSDIYALGCICYEILCGAPPFEAESPVGLIYKHANEQAIPPSVRADKKFSSRIDQVILKALAKNPESRFQSMEEFATSLSQQNSETEKHISTAEPQGKILQLKKYIKWLVPAALIGAVFASLYCTTDAGQILLAQISLHFNHSKKLMSKWANMAYKLEAQGKSAQAASIWSALEKSNPEPAYSKFLLATASERFSQNDKQAASFFAKLCLLRTIDEIRVSKNLRASTPLWLQLDSASSILLQCKTGPLNFSKLERKSLIQCVDNSPSGLGSVSLELAGVLINESKTPASKSICEILLRRDIGYVMRYPQNSSGILANLAQTEKILSEYGGINSPEIMKHSADLAQYLSDPDKGNQKLCLQLLSKAEKDCLLQPEKDGEYFGGTILAIGFSYKRLGKPEEAVRCFKTAMSVAKESNPSVFDIALIQSAQELFDAGEYGQALELINKESKNSQDIEYVQTKNHTHVQVFMLKVECLKRLKRNKDALNYLNEQLQLVRQHLPNSACSMVELLQQQFVLAKSIGDESLESKDLEESIELDKKYYTGANLRFRVYTNAASEMIEQNNLSKARTYVGELIRIPNDEILLDNEVPTSDSAILLLKVAQTHKQAELYKAFLGKIISLAEAASQQPAAFRTFKTMNDVIFASNEFDEAQKLIQNCGRLRLSAPEWFQARERELNSRIAIQRLSSSKP